MLEVAYDGVFVAGAKYRLKTVLDVLEEFDGGHAVALALEPEPTNPFDENAVKVIAEPGRHIGYLPAPLAETIAYRGCGAMKAELVTADIDDAQRVHIEIRVLVEG